MYIIFFANSSCSYNTGVGAAALLFNTTGEQNTATGVAALFNHGTGNANTAIGSLALFSDTSGQLNTAIGAELGLVAEDVEKVDPNLIVRDKEGKAYSVRYDQVNAMLLNEFLKEHRKVDAQKCKIDQQDAKIARLEQQVEALAASLQKVSAKLELNDPQPRTVLNNQ